MVRGKLLLGSDLSTEHGGLDFFSYRSRERLFFRRGFYFLPPRPSSLVSRARIEKMENRRALFFIFQGSTVYRVPPEVASF